MTPKQALENALEDQTGVALADADSVMRRLAARGFEIVQGWQVVTPGLWHEDGNALPDAEIIFRRYRGKLYYFALPADPVKEELQPTMDDGSAEFLHRQLVIAQEIAAGTYGDGPLTRGNAKREVERLKGVIAASAEIGAAPPADPVNALSSSAVADNMTPDAGANASEAKPASVPECECFGDSGIHASTFVPLGSDREHCDFCGRPVPKDSTDILTAVNAAGDPVNAPDEGKKEPS